MTKKQKYNAEDNRGVAIYARKSRITNKGDSIGVQFKQCEEYAKRELNLDEDYTFLGLHFFLGDGFFARGIDRNLIRVKK